LVSLQREGIQVRKDTPGGAVGNPTIKPLAITTTVVAKDDIKVMTGTYTTSASMTSSSTIGYSMPY